ncbi:hypothetical protein [Anaerophilus nitritogenes]|uniref:hypothetical protein n=1 Tax=Anaerophilus nitritogenes TaxID=2498136 RepID=UPI00101DBF90|nr:hypothetical protein [Anaerophilus nitritogenes]
MKKFLILLLTLILSLGISTTAFAEDSMYVNERDVKIVSDDELLCESAETDVELRFVNDFRNRKVNVSTYNEWSPFKRVSDNVVTGSEGGSISSTKTATFGTSVTGSISGLGISTNSSISSTIGYTLNVGKNKRVYMGYRVYYTVEKGTNEYYDIVTGKVIRSNKYIVKVPLYGEYKLINY